MLIAQDVGQWVDFLLKRQVVCGVYFGVRGFYEVLLADTEARNLLLEVSPFIFNTQVTHILPWALTKDYHSLIHHKCHEWIEIVDFPCTWRCFLPLLAAQLGKVICLQKLDANTNRFCILWNSDKPTPEGIMVDSGDPWVDERPFKLKWGKFVNSYFTCGKFGHIQFQCPEPVLQPRPLAVPSSPLVTLDKSLADPKKPSVSIVNVAPNVDKGKTKLP
ncbi:hypothetical protein L7F22_057117 [Adiantum nelumboides]|nr:hypothetical protein [Adiantum nelumboides]